jgi:hypothetical protein
MAVCHVGETWGVQSPSMGSVSLASLMDTVSSGLEVANAATVAPTSPGDTRAQCASPTVPRTNNSPPISAQRIPSVRAK